MRSAFDRAIRQVHWRCHVNLLLEQLMLGLLVSGAIAAGAAVVEKVFAIRFIQLWMIEALLGLSAVVAAAGWAIKRKDRMAVAIYIDDRLRLRERFSTALALHDSNDPFAQAACVEAHESAKGVHLKGQFPIRVSRRWMQSAASWIIALGVFFFMPAIDVLGFGRQENARKEQIKKVEETRADVKKEIQNVTSAVNKLGDKDLAAELAKLEQAAQETFKPEEIKPQSIRKLEEIAQELQKKNGDKIDTMKNLEQMLKAIKGSPQGNNELNRAIAKGDFKRASEIVKESQQKIDDKSMDSKQQEALKEQLQNIAEQLDKIAEKNKDIEDRLAEAGLNKDAANMDPDKLREALAKQGLTKEQIDKLMQDIANSRAASDAVRKLASAMKQAGSSGNGGLAAQLDELSDQLSEMEAQLQEAELAQATSNELKKCMGKLGKCAGQGDGDCEGMGDWAEGLALGQSRASGGPGMGMGERPVDDRGDVSLDKTKATSPVNDGPAIASSFIKGSQVVGESKKQMQDIVQAAKDSAAEAISENQIPKKYEGSIKGYFDQMGGKDEK